MTEPIRMCVACRRRAAKGELVRLVVRRADRGTVVVDPHARRPGRGAYVCRRDECLARALHRGGAALRRGLRAEPRQVSIDADALAAQWASAVQAQQHRNGPGLRPNGVRETA